MVIEELMKASAEMYVTVCADNLDVNGSDEDSDIFYSNKVTASKLMRIAEYNNVEILKPIFLEMEYRFKNDELLHLEENIYANVYEKYKKENENIKLFLAVNPYSEIEYVASKIVENVRDNRI